MSRLISMGRLKQHDYQYTCECVKRGRQPRPGAKRKVLGDLHLHKEHALGLRFVFALVSLVRSVVRLV